LVAKNNSLPATLQDIRDTKAFKQNLETELFSTRTQHLDCLYMLLITYSVKSALENLNLNSDEIVCMPLYGT